MTLSSIPNRLVSAVVFPITEHQISCLVIDGTGCEKNSASFMHQSSSQESKPQQHVIIRNIVTKKVKLLNSILTYIDSSNVTEIMKKKLKN